MNQGIPFARTIRALDADDFRASKLSLLLAAALLAAWIWWALAARVPQYATSSKVQLDASGHSAIAFFLAPVHGIVRPGQPATLRAGNSSVNATVTAVSETSENQIQVGLQFAEPASTLPQPITAELEIERVSPANIALRAAGFGNP